MITSFRWDGILGMTVAMLEGNDPADMLWLNVKWLILADSDMLGIWGVNTFNIFWSLLIRMFRKSLRRDKLTV